MRRRVVIYKMIAYDISMASVLQIAFGIEVILDT
jgi:hypothetical protein